MPEPHIVFGREQTPKQPQRTSCGLCMAQICLGTSKHEVRPRFSPASLRQRPHFNRISKGRPRSVSFKATNLICFNSCSTKSLAYQGGLSRTARCCKAVGAAVLIRFSRKNFCCSNLSVTER